MTDSEMTATGAAALAKEHFSPEVAEHLIEALKFSMGHNWLGAPRRSQG